jgi:PGF-pre-PGF domain-containing protein/PGF-CTERM protein
VVVGALTVGGAAPVDSATAQEVPSIPAVYYGEVSVTDGSVTSTFEIDAVADGEVQDTIEVTPNGTFGGPTISDDGLEVQEPDSGGVEFHVGGTPVTIVSVGGESIDDTTAPWDSGTQEVVLGVDAETIAPSLNVTITNATTSIDAGETATVAADVTNTGVVDATQEIELVNSTGTVFDRTTVTLQPGNTTDITLTRATSEGLVGGDETLTVRSEQDAENVTITVDPDETPPIAPPPSSGGGGGGGGGGEPITEQPTDDETNGTATNGTATNGTDTPNRLGVTESQPIVTSERFGLSQVRFATTSNIVAITWEGTEFNGSVTATTFARTPANVSAVPGAMATVSRVTVPADIANTSAIVEQRVARERLNEIDADVADLQVYRYADGAWAPVPTTVSETSGEEVIVESEVPGFSYLAVSAVSEPTAAIDAPATVTAGERVTLDGDASTDEYGNLTAYEWTLNGESLSGETATTTVETAGEVTVELEVTNDAGETNTATTTIAVEAAPGTTETATGTETTGSGTPGFTIGLTVIAVLVSGALARRLR